MEFWTINHDNTINAKECLCLDATNSSTDGTVDEDTTCIYSHDNAIQAMDDSNK